MLTGGLVVLHFSVVPVLALDAPAGAAACAGGSDVAVVGSVVGALAAGFFDGLHFFINFLA